MPSQIKQELLRELEARFGRLKRLNESHSLFELGNGTARVYVRYSKLHSKGQGFYGLRQTDLRELEGHSSVVCFLWDGQSVPLILPFAEYEQVFHDLTPADDGQFKAMLYPSENGTELYIARAGRFNVEGFLGWQGLDSLVESAGVTPALQFSHSQVQTLLGSIGATKGFEIWVPREDRARLDWSMAPRFNCRQLLPGGFENLKAVVEEIDVIWMNAGAGTIEALYEVEHSTPIYSGLLRFNDVHLVAPHFRPRFGIVANDVRREIFVRQVNRPTFVRSGLSELCSFLDYINVSEWHKRVTKHETSIP